MEAKRTNILDKQNFKCLPTTFSWGLKVATTPAIFYSYWKLDIFKAVMRPKLKVVTDVARCL